MEDKKTDELKKIEKLRIDGVLTNEEYDNLKTEMLNKKNISDNTLKKKTIIRVKLIHLILFVMVLIIIVVVTLSLFLNDKEVEKELINNTSNIINTIDNINVNQNYETNEVTKNDVLDIIDTEKKEIKLNASSLIDTIIDTYDEIEEQERPPIRLPLTYYSETLTDPDTGEKTEGYIIYHKGLEAFPNAVTFIIYANYDTKNIYRIAINHPYLNEFGTEMNFEEIREHYNLLFASLERLGYEELGEAINDMYNYWLENLEVSSTFNIKGIYMGGGEAQKNKYGNSSGMYIFYGTK